eukprot:Protomagalhaensia_sp_Gyna_25__2073@NODE_2112_length_1286_cov_8_076985_g1745_i0_p1_GENE_NODE_2112_length_1286_cov_8_076985_g1745_i0NODE_2112_length_1286_cov_8_076985_g1745_i0_p1_ORF_typecomplete_len151_score28_32Flu_B_NS1/PF02942_14/0_15_NODE_2112_length_1286_cov_8_076985_g1745_i07541206
MRKFYTIFDYDNARVGISLATSERPGSNNTATTGPADSISGHDISLETPRKSGSIEKVNGFSPDLRADSSSPSLSEEECVTQEGLFNDSRHSVEDEEGDAENVHHPADLGLKGCQQKENSNGKKEEVNASTISGQSEQQDPSSTPQVNKE